MNSSLSVREAAQALGVSVDTARRWIASGHLPAHRLGPSRLRIKTVDVERLLAGVEPVRRPLEPQE